MSNKPIADVDTPDPYMIAANGRFYLTFTLGNRVEIWSSSNMENFRNCQKSLIWHASKESGWSDGIWAPELHQLNGVWFVYFCGERPGMGNASHRVLILRSRNPDPMVASTWEFIGPMKGLPDHWAIDATVFSLGPNELYCCYSGWPLGDSSDTQQDLFLVKLASPEVAIAETLVCISRASLPWERPDGGRRGVNEGPQWVSLPGFQGIVYSANGSWTCDYQLGLLQLAGPNALQERSWRKRNAPLLVSDRKMGPPFGPGHASFINSPYGDGRVYCIYHGTEKPDEGWANRKGRVLMLGPEHFDPNARPVCCGNPHATAAGTHDQPTYPGNQSGRTYQSGPPSGQHMSFVEKMENKVRKALGEL